MRIGIEAQRLLRPNKHGMDIVALELIRALQRIDQLNEYYIFVRPDVDRKCLNPSHNVHIVEIECPNYALWEQYYLPKFARKYKLDILHCTANTAPLFCNVPVVVTLHDVIFMEKMPKKSTSTTYQRLGNLYRKYIVPAAVKRAEHVVTVSHYEKKQIINTLPIPESKISVVHNGVGHSFKQVPILPQIQLVKHRYELPESYFFYLGNTDPKKNLLNVIKAFSLFAQKVENVFLVIADLSQHVIENQLKKIGCLSLMARIRCIGYVPSHLLPTIYFNALAFLYPSLRESFGLPILEAMSIGTPVLTSDAAAMPEIAGDAAFLADPTSPEDIYHKMMGIYFNEPKREEMIEAGYANAALFSWEKSASEMLKVYKYESIMA